MARSPTPEEMAGWEVLTSAAVSHADAVMSATLAAKLPSAERLVAARKAMRNALLPLGQQMRGSPMSELVRAVDRWAVMSSYERRIKAADLRRVALEAARLAGFHDDA